MPAREDDYGDLSAALNTAFQANNPDSASRRLKKASDRTDDDFGDLSGALGAAFRATIPDSTSGNVAPKALKVCSSRQSLFYCLTTFRAM
jgi:hypothetical protein